MLYQIKRIALLDNYLAQKLHSIRYVILRKFFSKL